MQWFFYILFILKLFLVLKGVMCMFGVACKMCEIFMHIVAFKIIFSMKRGYKSIFRFISILF